MADSTYRPRVYRERGGDKLVAATGGSIEADGGTVEIKASGKLTLATGAKWTRAVRTATQGLTLTGADSGVTVFSHVANLNHKLPNATGNKGVQYRFVLATGSLTALLPTQGAFKVHPQTGDKLYGAGLSSTGDQILVLSGATDALGDFVDLIVDDQAAWSIVGVRGNWALTTATA